MGKYLLSLSEDTSVSSAVLATVKNKYFLAQALDLCQELGARERHQALEQNLSRKSSNVFLSTKFILN